MIYISSLRAFIFSVVQCVYLLRDVLVVGGNHKHFNVICLFLWKWRVQSTVGLYGVRTAGVRAILEIFRCLGDFSVNRMT